MMYYISGSLFSEGFTMENRIRRFRVRTRDKTKTGALMPRPPYMVGIGADLLAEVSAIQFGVYEHVFTLTDAVLAEMARKIAHLDFVTPHDSVAKTFSIYLRNNGLPPFRVLDDPYAVIELPEESPEDKDNDPSIIVTAGEESILDARIPLLGIR